MGKRLRNGGLRMGVVVGAGSHEYVGNMWGNRLDPAAGIHEIIALRCAYCVALFESQAVLRLSCFPSCFFIPPGR